MDGKYIIILLFIFLVFLMGSINSTVTNNFYNNTTGSQDHYNLSNLSYADSGHTGFQSSDTLDDDVEALGYVKNESYNSSNHVLETSGGIYNVSSKDELDSILSNLSDAPSLQGDVIIQYQANISDNITIPNLIYNGYKLILQGEMQSELTFTPTSSAAVGAFYGNIVNSSGTMGVDAYLGKLVYQDTFALNRIYAIRNNTATTLYHAHNGVPSGSVTIKSWKYKHTGTITFAFGSSSEIRNLEVESLSSQTYVTYNFPYTTTYINQSKLNFTNPTITTNPVFFAENNVNLEIYNSVIMSSSGYVLRTLGKTFINTYPNLASPSGFFIYNAFSGSPAIDIASNSYSYMRLGFIANIAEKTTGQMGMRSGGGSSITFITNYIIENFATGFAYTGDGDTMLSSAIKGINNTVNIGNFGNLKDTNTSFGTSSGSLTLNQTTGVIIQGLTPTGSPQPLCLSTTQTIIICP